jgi:hypothetical protein
MAHTPAEKMDGREGTIRGWEGVTVSEEGNALKGEGTSKTRRARPMAGNA